MVRPVKLVHVALLLAAPTIATAASGADAAAGKSKAEVCVACHGAGGAGESPTVPYLAGQYAHYTALELQMWQRGFRRNSPTTMTLFSKLLDDQEIAALAAYYQQLGSSSPPLTQSRE